MDGQAGRAPLKAPRRAPGVRKTPAPVTLTPDEAAFVRSLVLHEDAAILAFNKPAGLSSQGGRGQGVTLDELLWAFARPGKARPRLIHRLDRDTSGVILTAKTQPAAAFLGKQLAARRFRKTYLALVGAGAPEPPEGRVDVPLRREEIGREAWTRTTTPDHPDAQAASTRYRTLAAAPQAALIECEPETGRMHQIRVHLAHLNRPLAGDARYGGPLTLAGRAVPRLMLHAAALEFPHPDGGRRRLEAPPPADFADLRAALKLA